MIDSSNRLGGIVLLSLFLVSTVEAACPADERELRADANVAYAAFEAADKESFRTAASAVAADLDCLTEIVSPETARQVHLVFAFLGSLDRDEARMARELNGVLAADPDYTLPTAVAPEGSRLRKAFAAADPGVGSTMAAHLPNDTALFVDGWPEDNRVPTSRASLVQIQDQTVRNWYLYGEGYLPGTLAIAIAPQRQPEAASGRRSRPLLVGGVATALASGAALSVGRVVRSDFMETSDPSEASEIYRQTWILGLGGYALGATAVGLTTGAVIVGEW